MSHIKTWVPNVTAICQLPGSPPPLSPAPFQPCWSILTGFLPPCCVCVSTCQACKFRDEYAAFQDVGAQVYGISSDSPAANKAFAESQRLPFPLLTDPAGALRKVR